MASTTKKDDSYIRLAWVTTIIVFAFLRMRIFTWDMDLTQYLLNQCCITIVALIGGSLWPLTLPFVAVDTIVSFIRLFV